MPCCDVEQYVGESLDSILSQPFAEWECIIGLEESRDRTEEIVRKYAAKDSRVKVFTAPRSGSCSASRNTGIEMATGEYVLFVDGDDTIAEGSLQRLHDKIAERPGADLYPCAIQVYNEMSGKNEEIRDNYPPDFNGELTGPEATLMIYSRRRDPCPMLQMTVFRREHLIAHGLRCLHGKKRQDSEFSPRALYLAKRVIPLHECFYIYRVRVNSISTLAETTGYFLDSYAAIMRSLLAFHAKVSRESGFDPRIARFWAKHWLTWICYYWFGPRAIMMTPRQKRLDTLRALFQDGFGDLDALMPATTLQRRIACRFVKLFVRHPRLAWLADSFFRFVYHPLVGMRDKIKA